jgi:hypothetical protein
MKRPSSGRSCSSRLELKRRAGHCTAHCQPCGGGCQRQRITPAAAPPHTHTHPCPQLFKNGARAVVEGHRKAGGGSLAKLPPLLVGCGGGCTAHGTGHVGRAGHCLPSNGLPLPAPPPSPLPPPPHTHTCRCPALRSASAAAAAASPSASPTRGVVYRQSSPSASGPTASAPSRTKPPSRSSSTTTTSTSSRRRHRPTRPAALVEASAAPSAAAQPAAWATG